MVRPTTMVLQLEQASEAPRRLAKHRSWLTLSPRVSDSVGLRFSGYADAAGLGEYMLRTTGLVHLG